MTCAGSSSNAGDGLLLAINGADERLQMALGRLPETGREPGDWTGDKIGGDAEFLAAQEWSAAGQSVRFLAPGVRQLLHGLGLPAASIRRIACVTGPGSFTGLRMSLALAEGLSAGFSEGLAERPLLGGIGHLELLGFEAAEALAGQGAVLALAWSRRGQVYAQAFQGRTALTPPRVAQLAEMPALLAALPRPLAVLGGGLRRNLAAFRELAAVDSGLRLLPAHWDAPRPQALLTLASRAAFGPGPLAPVYLRASDAEDNLAAIAAGRGLSEEEAQAILSRGSRTLS
ncbi:MAG: tRNA (adenosine(37)-N6)-threonylcarbamoyltransferase complex dimerization subunit type 1 TsaB [Desulfovibrio sp.]|jgi:tRNA threonylcarbamoyl adenosine modification protein YeaZ|nr:tRNA (adenosine(37)-N6)-threonylcarbamoyltransferase complex dimerization subunit type 1 TsaB [Desulfovibrio sp.]